MEALNDNVHHSNSLLNEFDQAATTINEVTDRKLRPQYESALNIKNHHTPRELPKGNYLSSIKSASMTALDKVPSLPKRSW